MVEARWARAIKVALVATLATIVFSPSSAAAQARTSFPARICNVKDYGAGGTRVFLDTEAFQKAIDDCHVKGGGTVEVPRGEYLIGPIFLKSNIRLNLAAFSELVGMTDPLAYKVQNATRAYVTNADWIALINIADAQNVAITGSGRIDGQGATWWERWREQARVNMRGGATNRPRLVHAVRSRNLLFQGAGLYNSPSFHLVIKDSDAVTVDGMSFVALAHSPNTDAIDPIDSRDVLITNNLFDVGDDVVAIKSLRADPARPDSAVRNIVVRGNRSLAGRGISIGSETIGGVRDVLVEDNEFRGSMYGLRIKTPRERGGVVQDIVFRNNRMVDVETPLVVSSYYTSAGYDRQETARRLRSGGFLLGHQIYPPDTDPAQPYKPNSTPWIRNVRVEGLTASGADRAGIVIGLAERGIEGLALCNINIESRRGLLVRNADVTVARVSIRSGDTKPMIRERASRISALPNSNCGETLTAQPGRGVETPATVATSGKVQQDLASLPPEVLAAATSAVPGFRATSAEAETRDGRRYFDIGGRLPDGTEVEFDIMEEAGRWRVVETQRDIDYASVPASVRLASGIDAVLRPTRVIESRQSDGIVIYELFGPKDNDPQGMKVEVRWDGREARKLDQEWAH